MTCLFISLVCVLSASLSSSKVAYLELPFTSVSKRILVHNLSNRNDFDLKALNVQEKLVSRNSCFEYFETEVRATRKWRIKISFVSFVFEKIFPH